MKCITRDSPGILGEQECECLTLVLEESALSEAPQIRFTCNNETRHLAHHQFSVLEGRRVNMKKKRSRTEQRSPNARVAAAYRNTSCTCYFPSLLSSLLPFSFPYLCCFFFSFAHHQLCYCLQQRQHARNTLISAVVS